MRIPRPRPSKADLTAAYGATVPDVIAHGLDVLFCGINPGLYSGAVGHHFARPGNRFWRTLHLAGFTPRLLSAFEESELLSFGVGVTNLVERATPRADELADHELVGGARGLQEKLMRYRPGAVAFCGISAYRLAYGDRTARIGRQRATISGVKVWVLPNTSGLNAHYQLPDLARAFVDLRAESHERTDHDRR
ncbi:MAG: G/U mismatch-specific DNA glycosylase [Actinobacteria bacterium]|nr:G/U mismatch-specific DNA glycosylase [Actinomycetota bacterium]